MAWQILGWSPQQIRQARDLMGLPPGGVKGAATPPPAVLGPNGQPVDPAAHATQQNQPPGQQGKFPASVVGTPPASQVF